MARYARLQMDWQAAVLGLGQLDSIDAELDSVSWESSFNLLIQIDDLST